MMQQQHHPTQPLWQGEVYIPAPHRRSELPSSKGFQQLLRHSRFPTLFVWCEGKIQDLGFYTTLSYPLPPPLSHCVSSWYLEGKCLKQRGIGGCSSLAICKKQALTQVMLAKPLLLFWATSQAATQQGTRSRQKIGHQEQIPCPATLHIVEYAHNRHRTATAALGV